MFRGKKSKGLIHGICLLSCAGLLIGAAGCSSEITVELPDLSSLGSITVVTREEGSGTRSEFESLVDTTEAGANQIALSTDEVLALVESDVNAIGYLAYSSLTADDGVTVLAIDGISADDETIASGKYPLCREYMLAYIGELSDLEMDFITYIQSVGQEIVAEYCTPIDDEDVFLSGQYTGTITISGSSSVAPLMELLVEDYYNYNPNCEITIEVSDSTQGLNAAMRGECDLAMSSRSLASYEEELLQTEVIAVDAIAVVVNADSPLTQLTMEQLASIYDGDVSVWSDLN